MTLITLLGWACYAGALAAIVVYIIHFAQRQGWKRPWNAAGLFFTALALTQIPTLFRDAVATDEVRAAVIATLCLLGAAASLMSSDVVLAMSCFGGALFWAVLAVIVNAVTRKSVS